MSTYYRNIHTGEAFLPPEDLALSGDWEPVEDVPDGATCAADEEPGFPCGEPPLQGSEFCPAHDPDALMDYEEEGPLAWATFVR